MNHKQIETLKQFGEFQQNVSLATLTTLKIGGDAQALLYPNDVISLVFALDYCHQENIDTKVLGHGSNILASDQDYEGLIIKLTRNLNDVYFIDEEMIVGAGTSLVLLSNLAMKKSLSGLEWAAGIPATLGGAIFMNAGAYKCSMQDVVVEVLVYKNHQLVWMSNEECEFAYRQSIFQKNPDWIICGAKLKGKYDDMETIVEVMNRRKQQRLSTQPLDKASCGSTFRNPGDKSSWQLIEECGLRGYGIGGAQVSNKHANFLINTGHAQAVDMVKLIELVRSSVKDKFKVDLQLEVELFNWKAKNE